MKKLKSTIKERKTVKMTYISFWVHWLTEHAPKSAKYQFTKFGRLTVRGPKARAKPFEGEILRLLFLTRRRVFRKTKEDYQTKKNDENVLYSILGAIVGRARPKIC